MATQVNDSPTLYAPVVVNFGWWFGSSQQEIIGGIPHTPLNVLVTFDAIDSESLGLPTPAVPPGISIVSYQWNFGNGQTGFGPYAGTTFTYPVPVPGFQVSLSVVDSLGRTTSTARQINLLSIGLVGGGYRESAGTARS